MKPDNFLRSLNDYTSNSDDIYKNGCSNLTFNKSEDYFKSIDYEHSFYQCFAEYKPYLNKNDILGSIKNEESIPRYSPINYNDNKNVFDFFLFEEDLPNKNKINFDSKDDFCSQSKEINDLNTCSKEENTAKVQQNNFNDNCLLHNRENIYKKYSEKNHFESFNKFVEEQIVNTIEFTNELCFLNSKRKRESMDNLIDSNNPMKKRKKNQNLLKIESCRQLNTNGPKNKGKLNLNTTYPFISNPIYLLDEILLHLSQLEIESEANVQIDNDNKQKIFLIKKINKNEKFTNQENIMNGVIDKGNFLSEIDKIINSRKFADDSINKKIKAICFNTLMNLINHDSLFNQRLITNTNIEENKKLNKTIIEDLFLYALKEKYPQDKIENEMKEIKNQLRVKQKEEILNFTFEDFYIKVFLKSEELKCKLQEIIKKDNFIYFAKFCFRVKKYVDYFINHKGNSIKTRNYH